MSGQKIIDGLKDAVAGNFSRVTIDGQVWVRADAPPIGQDNAPSTEFAKLDLDSLFNVRKWVQAALEAKGAKCVGAGIGCGGTMGIADVQIELDGHQYNIEIKPI